jgi:hypothetical protein
MNTGCLISASRARATFRSPSTRATSRATSNVSILRGRSRLRLTKAPRSHRAVAFVMSARSGTMRGDATAPWTVAHEDPMRKQQCPIPPIRKYTEVGLYPALFVVVAATMLAVVVTTALAVDDIQQIKLGPHILYVPKAWMAAAGVTAFLRPQGMIQKPQAATIETDSVAFRPGEDWSPLSSRDLPDLIRFHYGRRYPNSPLDQQLKQWLDAVASLAADEYGFSHVAVGSAKPDERPTSEILVYKGYLNEFGEPLVVQSDNLEPIPGKRFPSKVLIGIQTDITAEYRFNNKQFPESTWRDLYQHVLAFFDYLQKPK